MEVKVASTCLNWSQIYSQTVVSSFWSPSSKRGSTLTWRHVHSFDNSVMFGSNKIYKLKAQIVKRGSSASSDAFSDEEFSKQLQELALRFQFSEDEESELYEGELEKKNGESSSKTFYEQQLNENHSGYFGDWHATEVVIQSNIERKANSVELPLSLRIIKRKKQWQNGFKEAGESACCSVKKAFSSMVFIIRELQSYTLQMREILFYEDLQGILVRVQKEMNASFVWLFQQVFSQTPTLMAYVMILLANYSVHSISNNSAFAATAPPPAHAAIMEFVSAIEDQPKFDSSSVKTFLISSSNGKMSSIGGINGGGGGGGKIPVVGSGTDGDGRFHGSVSSDYHGTTLPEGVSSINPSRTSENEVVSSSNEQEVILWNSILEESSSMQGSLRDESLDQETMQRFVSPVIAKIESDYYEDYFKTELLYQTGLLEDPSNCLLLANYAQFLFLVAQDYDRAENYFKRAVKVEPEDAETLNKYAVFLWKAKKDLFEAEKTYLEAISVEPANSYYAANYAHFLWTTGGEDTCFPLSSLNSNADEI